MSQTSRVTVPAILGLLLVAACSGPGTGAGGSDGGSVPSGSDGAASPPASAPASAEASASADGPQRVDIGVLAADPGAFAGQEITVLARVDEALVDGAIFLTSPSGTAEDQLAVVVRPDAQIDKEPAPGTVLWVDGAVFGVSPEDLSEAGVDVSADDLGGFEGEHVVVADALRDPLAGG